MRAMRISLLALTVTVCVLLGVRADGAAKPAGRREPQPAKERVAAAAERFKDLESENRRLRDENRLLRRQLKALRDQRAAFTQPIPKSRTTPSDEPRLPGGDRVPPGSVPGEINGLRFYVIPLQGSK